MSMPESGSIVSGTLCTAVADDNSLELGACSGAGDQDWRLTIDGQLRVQDSLQCASVIGCSATGAAVEQAACSTTAPDQKWTFDAMTLVHGATGKCANASLAADACTNAAQFTVRPDTETIELDGKCLTAGTTIALAECDGSPGQQWMQARGGFVSRVNTARCMRVDAAGKLGLADCTDDADQRWALRGEIRDGRADLCLQGGADAGSKLALAACDGTAAQQFTLWSR
jgi:hypothetical protein